MKASRVYSQRTELNTYPHVSDHAHHSEISRKDGGKIISSDAVSLGLCRASHQHLVGVEMMDGPSTQRKNAHYQGPEIGKHSRCRSTTAPTAPDRDNHTVMCKMTCGEIIALKTWDSSAACFLPSLHLPYSNVQRGQISGRCSNLPRSARISLYAHVPWQTRSGSRSRRAVMSMRWIWSRPRRRGPPRLDREIPSIDRRSVAEFLSLVVPAGARSLE